MSRHRPPRRFGPADFVAIGVMLAVLAVLLPLFMVQLRATALLP